MHCIVRSESISLYFRKENVMDPEIKGTELDENVEPTEEEIKEAEQEVKG